MQTHGWHRSRQMTVYRADRPCLSPARLKSIDLFPRVSYKKAPFARLTATAHASITCVSLVLLAFQWCLLVACRRFTWRTIPIATWTCHSQCSDSHILTRKIISLTFQAPPFRRCFCLRATIYQVEIIFFSKILIKSVPPHIPRSVLSPFI